MSEKLCCEVSYHQILLLHCLSLKNCHMYKVCNVKKYLMLPIKTKRHGILHDVLSVFHVVYEEVKFPAPKSMSTHIQKKLTDLELMFLEFTSSYNLHIFFCS
jgi:hypothetical protein